MTEQTSFSNLVSLACHDLRTPLATVYGYARTLSRADGLDPTLVAYSEMIETAGRQLAELLDELSLAARIEGGRYEAKRETVGIAEIAAAAAEALGAERVAVSGEGADVSVDVAATKRSISALVQSALRHGGFDEVSVVADGPELRISPITPASAPVVLGESLRDLGAAVAVKHIQWLGGSVAVEAETLTIRFA